MKKEMAIKKKQGILSEGTLIAKKFPTAFGPMAFIADGDGIRRLFFVERSSTQDKDLFHSASPAKNHSATVKIIQKYLKGDFSALENLTWTTSARGTPFQKRVWRELRRIPPGQALSYQEVARRIGKPKATRAVGGACNRNPIPLLIPCHRVLGKDGSLTGFGCGLDIKKKLLDLEGIRFL